MLYRIPLLAFLLLTACRPRTGAYADEVCRCVQPLLEVNDRIARVTQDGSGHDTIVRLFEQAGKAQEQARRCIRSLRPVFPRVDPRGQDVRREIEVRCPGALMVLDDMDEN